MDKRLLASLIQNADFNDPANRGILADALDEAGEQPVAARLLRGDDAFHHELAALALREGVPLHFGQTPEEVMRTPGPKGRKWAWAMTHPVTGAFTHYRIPKLQMNAVYAYADTSRGHGKGLVEYHPAPKKPKQPPAPA